MKVNEILKKINNKTRKQDVILRDYNNVSISRIAWGLDFANGYYNEKDKTVVTIDLKEDKVIIYYK